MRRAKEIKEGYLYEFFDVQSIQQGKTLYVKVSGELFGHPVKIHILNPDKTTDLYFYKVRIRDFCTVGRARGGTFEIQGQFTFVYLKILDNETFDKVYDIINGN